MYHTFYEYESNLQFELNFSNYYRSSMSRKSVKHCFESTLLDSSYQQSHQVGFSCSYNERQFVSFYPYSQSILLYLNGQTQLFGCSIQQDIGETIEICFDSDASNFTIIKNDEKCNAIISFPKVVTWFLYLDHSNHSTEAAKYDFSKVLINAGKNNFINQIPDGYEKWYTSEKSCNRQHLTKCSSFNLLFIYVFMI